jgi:hypothetical protein
MKKYINAALSLATVGMLFYTIHNQKQQINFYRSKIVTADSTKINIKR